MLKVKNKETKIHKVNYKVKNKDTVDVVLATLLLTLSVFDFLLQCFFVDFHQLIVDWGCRLLFWHFVPARI